VTERVGSFRAVPSRWAGPVSDDADPTAGRHVLDRDAALTPIFTSLRRGGWRRSHPPATRALRTVADPVDRFRDDPPTAPIPVVPALYAVDPWGGGPATGCEPAPIDPYVPASFAPPCPAPSPSEVTTWWSPAAPETEGFPVVAHPRYDAYEPVPFPTTRDPQRYDPLTDTGRHHRRLAPAGW
jgi:hypothetical protein